MPDAPSGFLSDYLDYTRSYHYPDHWSLACGMVLTGMATGAHSHITYRAWPVRPLIHPIMIGDSGAGKGAVTELMHRVRRLALPDLLVIEDESTTKGMLVSIKDGQPGLICAEEMTTMFNGMDFQKNIVPILTRLADNNRYSKRLGDHTWVFHDIRLSMVLGSNEEALREHFTTSIIKQGLASRFLWLYSGVVDEPLDGYSEVDPIVQGRLARAAESLKNLCKISGPSQASEAAVEWYRDWHVKYRNVPESAGMSGYYSRRHLSVWRAALISALSRSSMTIELSDMEWAWAWIQSCESDMFGIFERLGRSKWGQYEDALVGYLRGKDGWVNESVLTRKFGNKWSGATSVRRILDSLRESHIINREATGNGGWHYRVEKEG